MESRDIEIHREKVFVPKGMSVGEITEKYGISKNTAHASIKRGWFIKNYNKKQVIIDREHFHPTSAYNIARKVFYKNFSRNPVARSIKEDLIQEAICLTFMQSGKVKKAQLKNKRSLWLVVDCTQWDVGIP